MHRIRIAEQIPSDFYRKGETARAVVARVDNKNNNPKIILSRTSVSYTHLGASDVAAFYVARPCHGYVKIAGAGYVVRVDVSRTRRFL